MLLLIHIDLLDKIKMKMNYPFYDQMVLILLLTVEFLLIDKIYHKIIENLNQYIIEDYNHKLFSNIYVKHFNKFYF
jgi:hypothetical protein